MHGPDELQGSIQRHTNEKDQMEYTNSRKTADLDRKQRQQPFKSRAAPSGVQFNRASHRDMRIVQWRNLSVRQFC